LTNKNDETTFPFSYQPSAKTFFVLAESCKLSADRWFLEGATQAPV